MNQSASASTAMNLRVLEWPHKFLGILTWRCARLKRLLCVCGVPRGARKPYHVRPQSPISFGNSVPLQISPTFTLPSLLACKCGCEGRNALDALCIPRFTIRSLSCELAGVEGTVDMSPDLRDVASISQGQFPISQL